MKYASNLILLALIILTLAACAGGSRSSTTAPPPRTSPLGIDQPDPELIAQRAIKDYRRGDLWGFLSHFGFMDAETGVYFTPADEEGDPFRGTTMVEVKPLAQSLFALVQSKVSTIEFSEPITIRNRPLTVEIPYRVSWDFSRMTGEERDRTMAEVNKSLAVQGQPPITFEAYVARVQAMPAESRHRFIYRRKKWYIDGATWRPYRIKQEGW